MDIPIKHVLDVEKFSKFLNVFSGFSGFSMALMEYPTNRFLYKANWQDICVKFDDACEQVICDCLKNTKQYKNTYKHRGGIFFKEKENKLIITIIPIIAYSKQIGTLVAGQVFFEKPDEKFFDAYIKEHGLDKEAYYQAVAKVPVVNPEEFKKQIFKISEMSELFVEMGFINTDILKEHTTLTDENTMLQLQKDVLQEENDSLTEEKATLQQQKVDLETIYFKLKESEGRYLNLFTNMQEGAVINEVVFDGDGNPIDYIPIDVNPAYENILGLKKEDTIGKLASVIYKSPGKGPYIEEYYGSIRTGKPVDMDIFYEPFNKYFKISAFGIDKTRFAVVFADTTEKKLIEKEYENERKKFQAISDGAQDAIIMLNNTGNINYWNSSAEKIFGYKEKEVLGKKAYQLLLPKELQNTYAGLFNTKGKSISLSGVTEIPVVHKNGMSLFVEISLSSVKLGEETFLVSIIRDVTDRKILENQLKEKLEEISQFLELDKIRLKQLDDKNKQLQKALKDAALANKAKGEFLANMSHEIRTPLNGIIGMIKLLADTKINAEQRQYLDVAESSAKLLLKLINDILDFSKIEAGKLELESIDFNLRDTIGDTLKAMALRAHEKKLELSYFVHPDVPDLIRGDAGRLHQIVYNLVGNAIKFTEKGEISVTVTLEKITNKNVMLNFAVKDTGIGIAESKKNNIFEAFAQADNSITRKYGGTGLGLSITSKLVEMMGGTLSFESEENQGSTFYFTIKFDLQKDVQGNPLMVKSVNLKGLPVMVINGNETNQHFLREVLASWGITPIIAASARNSFKQIEQEGHTVNIIILDLNMDGIEISDYITQLREKYPDQTFSIIVLASTAQSEDEDSLKSLGVSAYLTKPVKPSDLLDTIMTLITSDSFESLSDKIISQQPVQECNTALNILLAEDNEVNQLYARKMLEKRGHTVTVANNGKETIEQYQEKDFDIILMDVQMPDIDGIEATKTIRALEKHLGKTAYIIAVTAHAMKGDREKCLDAGMDDYVAKPINPEELYNKLKPFEAKQCPPIDDFSVESAKETTEIIDEDLILSRVFGDKHLLNELINIFKKNYPRVMDDIKTAIENRDAYKLERSAHSIKGSVGNFSAKDAYEAAFRLEKLGEANKLSQAKEAYKKLEIQIDRLVLSLNHLLETVNSK